MYTTGYNIEVFRFISSSDPIGVGPSTFTPSVKASNMDKITHGILEFPGNVTGTFSTDSATPNLLGFIPQFEFSMTAECEGGTIKPSNYMIPQLSHSITITKNTGEKRVEKAYVPEPSSAAEGEEWWSTFRHQLEAFVKKIKGEEPHEWYTKEDSIAELAWLQKTYEKVRICVCHVEFLFCLRRMITYSWGWILDLLRSIMCKKGAYMRYSWVSFFKAIFILDIIFYNFLKS